jgi:carboxyl-terminal processing protease
MALFMITDHHMKNKRHSMNSMKLFIIALSIVFISSCSDDTEMNPDNNSSSVLPDIGNEAGNIPEWIYEEMSFFYYWNNDLPEESPTGDEDPEAYFYSLLNDDDAFSYISDDAEAIKEEISGTIVAMGFSPTYGFFTNSENLFAVVEYVYPNSPAAESGLERGDIILKVDGEDLTSSNFIDLYGNTAFDLTLGIYDGSSIRVSDEVISVGTGTIELDPVIHYEVKEVDGTKVGYLVFVDFIAGEDDKWLNSLGDALSEMKSEGVSEFILDLRYNPGGEIRVAQYLASALAPSNITASGEVLVNYEYNENLQELFLDRQGENSVNLVTRFYENEYNLNLSSIYILTTRTTASASELIIHGLRPHMDVTVIGEPTFGKYYGSYVLYDQNDPPEHNWAIVPVVLKYANSVGETDFINGLVPDIFLQDNILEAKSFGDHSDPMLSTALSIISGEEVSSSRISVAKPYQPVYDLNRINRKNALFFKPGEINSLDY